MTARRRSAFATVVFLAFTTPLGIAAHLIAELAGLGWRDDAAVAFSSRHAYLAVLALAALGGVLITVGKVRSGERRARIAELVESLPFHGRGAGFIALSFLAQFAFFAVTQLSEGSPLSGGDVTLGVLAAAIASLLGAFAVCLGKRRILEAILALVEFLEAITTADGFPHGVLGGREPRAAAARRTPFSFRYRPPPVLAA